ncbi:FecR family protein [Bacteroides sp.]
MEDRNAELFFRYCKGLCTEAEKEEVEALLDESEEHRKLFRDFRNALALGEDIKAMEAIDAEAAYQKTQSKIRMKKRQQFRHQLVRYAAFLTLPLLLSSVILGYLYFNEPEEKVQYADITASVGSVIRYELPDNSIVWLNSGSTLRYPTVFKGEIREVDLQGEAYFEVKSDKKHPFYVNTPSGIRVYVYGTQFNVSAYESEDYIETVLESGHVSVFMPVYGTSETLQPGERLLFDKKALQFVKSKVDVSEKTAWKDGKLIFRNTSLDEMLKRLSRHFNVDIHFNNKSGKNYTFRATFRNESLFQILDYLSKSVSLKWKVEDPVQLADGTFTKKKVIVDLY